MKITRLAVPGKCGALGASGLSAAASLASSSLTSAGNRLDTRKSERIVCRRVMGWKPKVILSGDLSIGVGQFSNSKRRHRIDSGRVSRRNVAGRKRHQEEEQCDSAEGRWIGRADLK